MPEAAPKKYIGKNRRIPFYDSTNKIYRVKARVSPRLQNAGDVREHLDDLRAKAVRYFVTHYFPEFYTYFYDEGAFEDMLPEGESLNLARDLIGDISRRITVENYYRDAPPHRDKSMVIFKTTYDFYAERKKLIDEEKMPSYNDNVAYFREKNEISEPTGATTLLISNLGTQTSQFNNAMSAFSEQASLPGFEGHVSLNVNFNFLQRGVQQILNIMVTEIVSQLRNTSESRLTDADTLTIEFGRKKGKLAVIGFSYLLASESIQNSPLKVGGFSTVLYNNALHDPLTVGTLQNYESIVQGVQNVSITGQTPSFYNFLSDPSFLEGIGSPGPLFDPLLTTGSAPGSLRPFIAEEREANRQEDIQNEYVKAALDLGIINASHVEALTKGFTESYDSKEIDELVQKVLNNHQVNIRVKEAMARKSLDTAIQVADAIEAVLLVGPVGLIGKANPAVAKIIRSLGIDELLKEVMLCITFGLNFEAARIGRAVKSALQRRALPSIYYTEPDLPEPAFEIPAFDLKDFVPKMKDGNIGELILQILIDTVQQTVLEIIKKLAELIRESCQINNPHASDYGASSIGGVLKDPAGNGLAALAQKHNMAVEELRRYLSALSGILTSIDVCNLFSVGIIPPTSLLNRIVEFNLEYDNVFITENLSSPAAVVGVMKDLAKLVDITDLCDEIANTVLVLNQADVCLALADAPDLGNLTTLPLPELNFDCMDAANFINDPTITKSIPEAFNTVLETVKVSFINSTESLKETLLEPAWVRGGESSIYGSAAAAKLLGHGPDMHPSWSPTLDPAPMEKIQESVDMVMGQLNEGADAADRAVELFENCDVPPQELFGVDIGEIPQVFTAVLREISTALAESNFEASAQGMSDSLAEIMASGLNEPIVKTYRFNQQFYQGFAKYLKVADSVYSPATTEYIVPENFISQRKLVSEVASSSPQVGDPPGLAQIVGVEQEISDREPFNLKFNFSTLAPSRHAANREESLSIIYPHNYPGHSQQARLNFASTSGLVFKSGPVELGAPVLEEILNSQEDPGTDLTNLYLQRFVDAYMATLPTDPLADPMEDEETSAHPSIIEREFPKAYVALVAQMIDYIVEHGVFDAATLQTLNFFHLNEGCPPDEIADLLDTQGILEQMTKEYAEQACSDRGVSIRDKIRRALKFGLLLTYIQIHIAEFIIKNIFVFSAFTADSLIQSRDSFVFQFMTRQIKDSLFSFLDDPDTPSLPPNLQPQNITALKNDMLGYFGKKLNREVNVSNGGIRYTQSPEDLVFPVGTVFTNTGSRSAAYQSSAENTATFEDIIEYLVAERLYRSRTALNNVLRKALKRTDVVPVPLTEALISTYPVLHSTAEIPANVTQLAAAAEISFREIELPDTSDALRDTTEDVEIGPAKPTIFVLDEMAAVQPPVGYRREFSLWFYTGDDTYNPIIEWQFTEDGVEIPRQESPFPRVIKLINKIYSKTYMPPSIPAAVDPGVPDPLLDQVNEHGRTKTTYQRDTGFEEFYNAEELVDPGTVPEEAAGLFWDSAYGAGAPDSMIEDILVGVQGELDRLGEMGMGGLLDILDLAGMGLDPAAVALAFEQMYNMETAGQMGGGGGGGGGGGPDRGDQGTGDSGGTNEEDEDEDSGFPADESTSATAIWGGPFGNGEGVPETGDNENDPDWDTDDDGVAAFGSTFEEPGFRMEGFGTPPRNFSTNAYGIYSALLNALQNIEPGE